MTVTDLSRDEQLALLGLARMIIRADNEVTVEEASTLGELAADLDPSTWQALVRQARERYPDRSEARRAASAIGRPEVRAWVHLELSTIAAADGVAGEELELLDWLSEQWHLDLH